MTVIATGAKSRKHASMSMRVIKADGSVVDLGTVSNTPILGAIQRWLQERRIRRYRKSMGMN